MDLAIRATGTLEPEQLVDVGAEVAGTIKRFGDDPSQSDHQISWGSKVEVGTVLAYIDDTPYQALLDLGKANLKKARAGVRGARAALKKASADYERKKALFAKQTLAQADLDEAEFVYETAAANAEMADAQVELDEAALKQAQINLEYTHIKSPIKGTVIDRRANIGQAVVANLNAPSLFLIAKDLTKLQVWTSVNEADIAQIRAGQTATFSVDAHPGKVFEGRVSEIRLNATMTQNVVTYTVVVTVDNAKGVLMPYMTATVTIKADRHVNILMVPNGALSWLTAAPPPPGVGTNQPPPGSKRLGTRSRDCVRIPDGESMRPIQVKLGASDGSMTEVIEGDVKEGMQVIVGRSVP